VALTAAYAAISGVSFAGDHGEAVLLVLMTVGGFALGTQFSSMLAHITSSVATEHAADISGVTTTAGQIGGAIGVAGFGTLYFGASASATHAFALVAGAFAAVALLAVLVARLAVYAGSSTEITRPRRPSRNCTTPARAA
jgi:cyanate permease